jgi:hypothetical protein
MSFELAHYDTAMRELALATEIDEVKAIRDKAIAMQVYAKLAQNKELIENAFKIKERAEIQLGEMLYQMKIKDERTAGGRAPVANPVRPRPTKRVPGTKPVTLADLGVSKGQAFRWQRKAALANGRPLASSRRGRKSSTAKAQRDRRDRKIGLDNLKGQFGINCAKAEDVAKKDQTALLKNLLKFGGSIDEKMRAACRHARDAWIELTAQLGDLDGEGATR